MKFFRKLLVMCMIVWLPLAGAMAAVMPLSAPLATASTSNATSSSEVDVSQMPCHGKAQLGKTAFGQGCSHCVLCHLAGALVMPEMPVVATVVPTHIFHAAPVADHPSFIPELIAPPPRASLA